MIQPSPRIFLHHNHHHTLYPATFGQSMFDTVTNHCSTWLLPKTHYDRCVVQLQQIKDEESGNPIVHILPLPQTEENENTRNASSWSIPFARTRQNISFSSTLCPTLHLTKQNYYETHKPHKSFVSLSAVAVITNIHNEILVTRRASDMRTFPKAWVMPGGGIDPGETIIDGVMREVKEETGLHVDPLSVEPIGMWESCYPTSGEECIHTGKGLLAHHLVVFCKCQVNAEKPDICLQEDETDMAVWINHDDFQRIISDALDRGQENIIRLAAIAGSQENLEESSIPINLLRGIYPNGNEKYGIAQGNLFMLEEYFGDSHKNRSAASSL